MSNVKMPEPVAYMNKDGYLMNFSTSPEDHSALITTDQAEAYAQARVLESRPTYFGDGYQAGWNSALDRAANRIESLGSGYHVDDYADAIRALKEQS